MGRSAEMWQDQEDANQAQYMAEMQQAEEDMEPHKRTGYFAMMCDMADEHRKWLKEQGI